MGLRALAHPSTSRLCNISVMVYLSQGQRDFRDLALLSEFRIVTEYVGLVGFFECRSTCQCHVEIPNFFSFGTQEAVRELSCWVLCLFVCLIPAGPAKQSHNYIFNVYVPLLPVRTRTQINASNVFVFADMFCYWSESYRFLWFVCFPKLFFFISAFLPCYYGLFVCVFALPS